MGSTCAVGAPPKRAAPDLSGLVGGKQRHHSTSSTAQTRGVRHGDTPRSKTNRKLVLERRLFALFAKFTRARQIKIQTEALGRHKPLVIKKGEQLGLIPIHLGAQELNTQTI